jgi:hypothetical protein
VWDRSFPPDDGDQLLDAIRKKNNTIYGASDASLKHNNAARAWVISSGHPDDIESQYLSIQGSGLVGGYCIDLSSTRGEIQGQTVIMIIGVNLHI